MNNNIKKTPRTTRGARTKEGEGSILENIALNNQKERERETEKERKLKVKHFDNVE